MPSSIELVAGVLFALAVIHTFSTKFFESMATRHPDHAGMWHLLGEVEVVFGFWAFVLVLCMAAMTGPASATTYLDTRNFTEPMFVFAIMVVAASRPVLHLVARVVDGLARSLPVPGSLAFYFLALSVLPLLGSFITEPAAMTLAALMLRDRIFARGVPSKVMYGTLGVLFVNISIGGTLTAFAAPPVLMVASQWGWDSMYMLTHFGWRSALAVVVNAAVVTMLFSRTLVKLPTHAHTAHAAVPSWVTALHVLFLAGIVAFAHHPAAFMGIFLFFMGLATAYRDYQDRLILREGLLVAFFLAGLVVLGGMQTWWLAPLLKGMDAGTVYAGATALTAVTDNAALTYLGSLVPDLDDAFKHALVAGAVTGGGLTVIANAPNPAGFAILRGHFNDGAIHPLGLFLAAAPATAVAVVAFRFI